MHGYYDLRQRNCYKHEFFSVFSGLCKPFYEIFRDFFFLSLLIYKCIFPITKHNSFLRYYIED